MANNPYLMTGLRTSPKLIRRLAGRLAAEPSFRPDPERFSVHEVVCHLADWEPILRERMVSAVEQPNPTIAAYDEGERATAYASWSFEASLDLFAKERATTLAWLSDRAPTDFERPLIHPERGPMVMNDVANMLVGHDLYHIEQLDEMVHALGRLRGSS